MSNISDERLAELEGMAQNITDVLVSRGLNVGAYADIATALRELQHLRALLSELRPSLERWDDAGPRDEGWKSDELLALLSALPKPR